MQRPRETLFLGLFFIPAPQYILRLDKFSSVRVGAYCIRPTNASAWRRMTDKPDTFWGVCLCAPTYTDQKFDSHLLDKSQTRWVLGCMSLRPTYTDQKFDSHLLDESQTRQVLGCMSLRPTPPRREILKICMDARKTRRELDGYGHIHRKPGEDWMKMAISIENPAGIGRIWSYLSKTR